MIIDIRGKGRLGAGVIDVYPGIDDEGLACTTVRFTVPFDGKIYFEGEKWTPERMAQEWQRVKELQEAFDVAQAIVEVEKSA